MKTLNVFLIRAAWVSLLSGWLVLAGCSKPVEEPPAESEPVPVVEEIPEPEPVAVEPQVEPVEVKPDPAAEPNWKERFAVYKTEYLQEFQPRALGSTVTLKLKQGGQKVSGSLVGVDPDQVTIQLSAAEVGYPRQGLAPETRAMLYAEDYAHLKALGRVRSEEAEYKQEQVRRAEASLKKASVSRPSSVQGKPVVSARDGSVLQVKEYLQENTRNPESIRYLQWGKIQKHEEGFKVTCVYKVRSDTFGDTTESKYFFMNAKGRVLETAPYRGVQLE